MTDPVAQTGFSFLLNGSKVVLDSCEPARTLLEYLREDARLTGAKLGCGEGGCGACTVMCTSINPGTGRVEHRAINACLAPLASVAGTHITTVEGIGSMEDGVHPVQDRIAKFHGSQCGFCTPGIVMALYSYLREHPDSGVADIEECMDGNLCRCTGYRPLLDAAKSFASDKDAWCSSLRGGPAEVDAEASEQPDKAEPVAPAGHVCGGAKGHSAHVCAVSPQWRGDEAGRSGGDDTRDVGELAPTPRRLRRVVNDTCDKLTRKEYAGTWRDVAHPVELAFEAKPDAETPPGLAVPAELMKTPPPQPFSVSGGGVTWHRPVTAGQLLGLLRAHPAAKLVGGNSEVGIEAKFRHANYPHQIYVSHVSELQRCSIEGAHARHLGGPVAGDAPRSPPLSEAEKGDQAAFEQAWTKAVEVAQTASDGEGAAVLGAGTTLTAVVEACAEAEGGDRALPHYLGEPLRALARMLRWFASHQIRNVATLGGNVATASPISDLLPLLLACDATMVLAHPEGEARTVPAAAWCKGYRRTALRADEGEMLVAVVLPLSRRGEFVRAFKHARRREDDITQVGGAVRVLLRGEAAPTAPAPEVAREEPLSVAEIGTGFAGLAPTPITAPSVERVLLGARWCEASLRRAFDAAREDIDLPFAVPGGMREFRMAGPATFLFKTFVASCEQLGRVWGPGHPLEEGDAAGAATRTGVHARALSAALEFHRPPSYGAQVYDVPVPTEGDRAAHPRPTQAAEAGGEPVKNAQSPPDSSSTPSPDAGNGAAPHRALPAAAGRADGSAEAVVESGEDRVSGGDRGPQARTNAMLATPVPTAPAQGGPTGKPVMHASALLQATGAAKYADDITVPPGTLEAATVGSQHPHARVRSVDTSAARALPGVVAVLTAKDVRGQRSWGAARSDELVLVGEGEEVQFVGQAIVVAVAETRAVAQEAARAVVVSYEPLPHVLTIEEAIAAGSFYEPERRLVHGPCHVDEVMTDAGQTAVVVEGEQRSGGQEHFYLETNCSTAVPGEAEEGMTIYVSTQAADKTQRIAAQALGMDAHRVVVRVKRLGGGFGGKETRTVAFSTLAAVAAQRTRRPVRLAVERGQDMQCTGQRHAFYARYRLGVDRTGRITALDADLYNNGGAALDLSLAVMDRALTSIDNAYLVPCARLRGRVCRTHMPPHTAFRGFGGPQGMVIMEQALEHAAAALGLPTELVRFRNLVRVPGPQAPPVTTHYGRPMPESTVQRAWLDACARAELPRKVEEVAAFNAEHRYRKRGLAVVPTKYGINFGIKLLNQAGATVLVYADGSVLVSHGGVEIGQGLHTKMQQVAAAALGAPLHRVHVEETATDKVPNASPTAASASTDMYGGAVLDACRQIASRLAPLREEMPGATLRELAIAAYLRRIDLAAHGFYATPRAGFDWERATADAVEAEAEHRGLPEPRDYGPLYNYFTTGAAVAEVELDVLSGDLQLLRCDLLLDAGRSINPALDVGQVEGAFAQGAGWMLCEETVWGDASHPWVRPGHMLNPGPGTYKIPCFNDTPLALHVALLHDSREDAAVFSSKAVGEPPFFLASATFFAARRAVAAARAECEHGAGTNLAAHPLPAPAADRAADVPASQPGAVPVAEGGCGCVVRGEPASAEEVADMGFDPHRLTASAAGARHFVMDVPATIERLRMGCWDETTARAVGDKGELDTEGAVAYAAKGSF